MRGRERGPRKTAATPRPCSEPGRNGPRAIRSWRSRRRTPSLGGVQRTDQPEHLGGDRVQLGHPPVQGLHALFGAGGRGALVGARDASTRKRVSSCSRTYVRSPTVGSDIEPRKPAPEWGNFRTGWGISVGSARATHSLESADRLRVAEAEVLHQPLDVAVEVQVVARELLLLAVLLERHHVVGAARRVPVLVHLDRLPAVVDQLANL